MADDSQEVADIIDALGDAPAPLEVYNATRDYDTRYLASAGAAAAAGGGGGGSQPGAVRVLAFPFDYTMAADLANGVPVWTPNVGDWLLDAWIRTNDADIWVHDLVVARADIGVVLAGSYSPAGGYFNRSLGPAELETNALWTDENPTTYNNFTQAGIVQAAILSSPTPANFPLVTAVWTTTDPLNLVVSEDGFPGSAATDATAGSSILYLQVVTPAATP